MRLIRLLNIWSCVVLMACSSAPQKGEHLLHKILLYNLHVRRVDRVGALDKAEPGEYEYESHPRPNERFDCESLEWLFKDISFKALRECFLSSSKLQKRTEVSYILRRSAAPYLELEKPEEVPVCIKESLPRIPVPREIVFQSRDEGLLSCYSTRIPIEPEELLGIPAALHHFIVQVDFPPPHLPQTDRETVLLLSSWAVTPFFEDESGQRQLISKIVPNEMCRKCMGEKNMFHELDDLPPSWP